MILDLRLPDGSGVDVCRRLREWTQVPIVVVSAVDEETEKIAALDAGADDYVTKPYAVGELLARVRAAMRRAAAPPGSEPALEFGDVRVDLALREVTRGGDAVHVPVRADCGTTMVQESAPGDRILILGARDDTLTDFGRELLEKLASRA